MNIDNLYALFKNEPIILKSINKTIRVLNHYDIINVSISGGKDSDIMLALIELVRSELIIQKINYVFFDTGVEYQATYDHLTDLENFYNITIDRIKAYTPIPTATKQHGLPFISKRVSNYINRLQQHNFDWSDQTFNTHYEQYPHCKAALRWFDNDFEHKKYNIDNNKGLRDFLIKNPPYFAISDKCCECAKKKTASLYFKKTNADLSVVGVRKSEGGARSSVKTCWNDDKKIFYPLLWYTNNEIKSFENIINMPPHSKCYTDYGLKRTGCVGCPFGQDYENELNVLEKYEPKLLKLALNVFGDSYKYTDSYKKYRKEINEK